MHVNVISHTPHLHP